MKHQSLYDAANRLSLSMNAEGRVSGYRYNGLGQRTGIQEYMLTGYGYCWNNPLMLVDRNGAWPEFIENAVEWGKEHKGAVVAAVGVATLAVAAAFMSVADYIGVEIVNDNMPNGTGVLKIGRAHV